MNQKIEEIIDPRRETGRRMTRRHSALGTVMSASEACERIGCTYQTLTYLVHHRGLRPVNRTDKPLYFRTNELDAFISFGQTLVDGRL